jgi:hypothetical protein
VSPYIPILDRTQALKEPQDVGELTYAITKLCADYLGRKLESYAHYAEVMGALACTHEEIYRRRIAPYEDRAIARNGDVFP